MVAEGEHVVHFYADDADLRQAVGGYLIQAIGDGAAAIVIATDAHRVLFEEELIDAGIDVRR